MMLILKLITALLIVVVNLVIILTKNRSILSFSLIISSLLMALVFVFSVNNKFLLLIVPIFFLLDFLVILMLPSFSIVENDKDKNIRRKLIYQSGILAIFGLLSAGGIVRVWTKDFAVDYNQNFAVLQQTMTVHLHWFYILLVIFLLAPLSLGIMLGVRSKV